MPEIILTSLADAMGGAVPADAVLTATATQSRNVGAAVIANRSVTARLVAGVPTEPLILDASGPDWCWSLRLDYTQIRASVRRWVAVPDVGPVEWSDLVDVDPATLQPSEGAVPAWTAAVSAVTALLSETVDARDAAAASSATAEGFAGDAEAARDVAVAARTGSEAARDTSVAASATASTKATEASVDAAAAEAAKLDAQAAVTTEVALRVPPAVDLAIANEDIPGQVATALAAQAGKIIQGVGMPNGVVTATVGTLYVDTASTNGASIWRKASGSGNSGWIVVEGDTGWRNVATLLSPGWTGRLEVKRAGKLISWAGTLTMPSSGIVIVDQQPAGFTTSPAHLPNILGRNSTTGAINAVTVSSVMAWGGPLTAGNSLRFEGSYVTSSTWPTTLPGSPA